MLRAEKRYLPFSFIVVGALCMHRYHVLVRFNDNNFDNRSVAHENEKADISETVAFTSIAYHSPIMSQILGVHRERHYDEGEGDDVQFHVELRRVSSNWVSAIIAS